MDPYLKNDAARRDEFDDELRQLQRDVLGYQNTYFQPPQEQKLKYDCVVYEITGFDTKRADNKSYLTRPSFQVTVISRDPETPLPRAIQEHFERCAPGRFFVRDNLYQFPFTIFY